MCELARLATGPMVSEISDWAHFVSWRDQRLGPWVGWRDQRLGPWVGLAGSATGPMGELARSATGPMAGEISGWANGISDWAHGCVGEISDRAHLIVSEISDRAHLLAGEIGGWAHGGWANRWELARPATGPIDESARIALPFGETSNWVHQLVSEISDWAHGYMQKRFRESTHDEPNRVVTPSINIPVKLVEDADRIVQQICKAYCNPVCIMHIPTEKMDLSAADLNRAVKPHDYGKDEARETSLLAKVPPGPPEVTTAQKYAATVHKYTLLNTAAFAIYLETRSCAPSLRIASQDASSFEVCTWRCWKPPEKVETLKTDRQTEHE
ncbi:hypothetical protein BU15DRAFT_62994 [Melanogaster broomeanus]|nr:hypothetical protein BU15DRAFT_62994 [Melanogaster broomeanus]